VLLAAAEEAIRKQGLKGEAAEAVRKGVAEGLAKPWAGQLTDKQIADFSSTLPRYVGVVDPAKEKREDWALRSIRAYFRVRVEHFVGSPPMKAATREAMLTQFRGFLRDAVAIATECLGEEVRAQAEEVATESLESLTVLADDCLDPTFKALVPATVLEQALKETREAVEKQVTRIKALSTSDMPERLKAGEIETSRRTALQDAVRGAFSRVQGALMTWMPEEVGEAYRRAAEIRRKAQEVRRQETERQFLQRQMAGLFGFGLLSRGIMQLMAGGPLESLWSRRLDEAGTQQKGGAN